MNLLKIQFLLLVLPALLLAQVDRKMLAVIDVQLKGQAKDKLTPEEKDFLSTLIRSQASQILGDQVEILSQAKFKKLVKANSEGCSEAGCFAGFIAEIGVDLGMQPTISYAFGKLNLTLEVADSRATIASRVLSAPPTDEGKNQLGQEAAQASKELFLELATRLEMMSKNAPPSQDPAQIEPIADQSVPEPEHPTPPENTPVVDLTVTPENPPAQPDIAPVPSIPSEPSKPMSFKRKLALSMLGVSALGGAGGYWFESKASGYYVDYGVALDAWNKLKTPANGNALNTAYNNLQTAKTRRNVSYGLSLTSILTATVLWFWPE